MKTIAMLVLLASTTLAQARPTENQDHAATLRINCSIILRLPLGRDEWIGFDGSTILGDAFIEPAQGHTALIKRYLNRGSSPLNKQGIGCT